MEFVRVELDSARKSKLNKEIFLRAHLFTEPLI